MMFCPPKRKNPVDIGDALYIVSFNMQFHIVKTKVKDIQKHKKPWKLSSLIIDDAQTICICENDMKIDIDDVDREYTTNKYWVFSSKDKYMAFIQTYINRKIKQHQYNIEYNTQQLKEWENKLKVYQK